MLSKAGAAQTPFDATPVDLRFFGIALCPDPEAAAFVFGLNDLAIVRDTVEVCVSHIGLAEQAVAFTGGKVGGDEGQCLVLRLAEQAE